TKEMLKNLTSDAFEKDIFGAPTFVVNNKIFWGQDRLEYALDEYNS
ncbi:MAG: 2-hydroxychromene-2-carboxylate isomerase, partial [Pelagibacterales bacterium MED-G44]